VLTSQHIYETERFCSKVAVLKEGRLLIHTTLADLAKTRPGGIFELETDATIDALREAFGEVSCQITGRVPVYLIELPPGYGVREIVELLASQAVFIKAIRDISPSSRAFFRNVDE
jgi:ABC-type multidrug transport system ATPase subunit